MKSVDFFPKFNDLDIYSLSVDFHLHSAWTDGKNTVLEIIEYAQQNNLHSIAITDHIRKESIYFDNYKNELDKLNSQTNIDLYVGFEAKIVDFVGNIDVQQEVIFQSDIAIASVHRYQLGNKLYDALEFQQKIAQEIELELSLSALKRGGFNVLGHPGGMSLTYFEEFPTLFFEEIIRECVKYDIAFDFNGRYHRQKIDVIYPLLQKYNPHVSIGTDSHDVQSMGKWNKLLGDYIG